MRVPGATGWIARAVEWSLDLAGAALRISRPITEIGQRAMRAWPRSVSAKGRAGTKWTCGELLWIARRARRGIWGGGGDGVRKGRKNRWAEGAVCSPQMHGEVALLAVSGWQLAVVGS